MSCCVLYTTVATEADAEELAASLLADGVVACVNITAGRSVYRWNGKLEKDTEVFLLCKTTQMKRAAAIRLIETLHPYEVPCVTSWDIARGSEAYLEWIDEEVRRNSD